MSERLVDWPHASCNREAEKDPFAQRDVWLVRRAAEASFDDAATFISSKSTVAGIIRVVV